MQTTVLRIGTRGSPLALAQAHETRARLMAAHGLPEEAFAIEVISTSGDRIQDRPLSEAGGKGLFTKEIEEALLAGRIDIAVHSSKDMPTVLPEGLVLSAFLPREDPRDAFIGKTAKSIMKLPEGATLGSSSLRRQALILRMRPDLKVITFRGNVQTRLRKLDEGIADGTILALAGLKRLGLQSIVTDLMPLRNIPAGARAGRDLHRKPDRRPPNRGNARRDQSCSDRPGARLRARLSRGARRFLPHADRRPCGGRWRQAVLQRSDPDAGWQACAQRFGRGRAADAAEIGRAAGEKVRRKAGPQFFEGWS